jgi:hypothetical protein
MLFFVAKSLDVEKQDAWKSDTSSILAKESGSYYSRMFLHSAYKLMIQLRDSIEMS